MGEPGPEYWADEKLLRVLAEQLKLPLLQIARRAELYQKGGAKHALVEIEQTADAAIKLLDGYLVGSDIHNQTTLELEPVSVSSILLDTAHSLAELADRYHFDIELHVGGRYEPVLVHREALQVALTNLGMAFLETGNETEHRKRPHLKLAAHRSRAGIVTGVFADIEGLHSSVFKRAKELYGRSYQPLQGFLSSAGAGIFVADSILSSMATPLSVHRHQKTNGLATTLLLSKQLNFV